MGVLCAQPPLGRPLASQPHLAWELQLLQHHHLQVVLLFNDVLEFHVDVMLTTCLVAIDRSRTGTLVISLPLHVSVSAEDLDDSFRIPLQFLSFAALASSFRMMPIAAHVFEVQSSQYADSCPVLVVALMFIPDVGMT